MKLKCTNGCKVRQRGKFYREWFVRFLHDKNGKEVKLDEASWESYGNRYKCVVCHEPVVEK